ncbi:fimbria/pilus periplasmic chaperone [Providencia rettgeri]|uniref:Fimbria/pilus chaperone family protein n=3 Tax=Providencia TaxID=586 RepID=A0AA42FLC9_9GAMM|nr:MULTISPECIES: fimbria/pilus chaperone family protein [Providencia]HCI96740.1 fimbrial protein [Providencia sp.]APC10975.1 Chaperone protein EcpD precursor [Providencia rettgeri]AVL74520.1 fimbrial protein [Providencia rettgeri]EIU7559006.1 fimbria/pilus periplasmic chaperone [Providencia rettgeri]EJD6044678.1 fimbria/pilus periplasmic chaperone [Providencia rettgeri]
MKIKTYLLLIIVLLIPQLSIAAGILPATSVVVVNEKSQDGEIVVTNTDNYPVLLTTELVNVDPEYQDLVIATPQLIRVEPKAKQLIRFMLTSNSDLKHEVLMRVIFEGIPPQADPDAEQIKFTIRQNLPLIIKPKNLPENDTPWELLKWKYEKNTLIVTNPSPYIVRLSNSVLSKPGNIEWVLPSNYILPNQSIELTTSQRSPTLIDGVTIQPFTQWGYSTTQKYSIKLNN